MIVPWPAKLFATAHDCETGLLKDKLCITWPTKKKKGRKERKTEARREREGRGGGGGEGEGEEEEGEEEEDRLRLEALKNLIKFVCFTILFIK